MKVTYSRAARRRIAAADAWWRAERQDSPELLQRELDDTAKKLESMAKYIAKYYRNIGGLDYFRVRMKKTNRWVYITFDHDRGVIEIHSVWCVAQGKEPPLP